jgi:hypothetical protein
MIGREFVKHLRLRHGRIETIKTRFEHVVTVIGLRGRPTAK